jgi:hypothetical protein
MSNEEGRERALATVVRLASEALALDGLQGEASSALKRALGVRLLAVIDFAGTTG